MSLKKIKVSVIGVGNMGKNHVRTYIEMEDINLVAIADVNEDLGKNVSETFGVKLYEDYKEMIDIEKPDVVSICVPTIFHYDVAYYCIKNGINVLLEKPICLNISEAIKLRTLAKKKKVKFLVGHIERFNPAVKKVKEMIVKRELGDIIAIIARRVGGFPPQIKDANIVIDLAIHDVDIVNYLLDENPNEILVNKQKNHILRREDSVELFLKYKKTSAYVQANWVTPVKIRKLNITGTEGYLEMDYISQSIEFYKSNYNKFTQQYGSYSDYILEFSEPDKMIINVARKEPLKEEIRYFINCVLSNIDIDIKFAIDALKIVSS